MLINGSYPDRWNRECCMRFSECRVPFYTNQICISFIILLLLLTCPCPCSNISNFRTTKPRLESTLYRYIKFSISRVRALVRICKRTLNGKEENTWANVNGVCELWDNTVGKQRWLRQMSRPKIIMFLNRMMWTCDKHKMHSYDRHTSICAIRKSLLPSLRRQHNRIEKQQTNQIQNCAQPKQHRKFTRHM